MTKPGIVELPVPPGGGREWGRVVCGFVVISGPAAGGTQKVVLPEKHITASYALSISKGQEICFI